MAKGGNKGGGGNSNQKAAATGGNFNVALNPEQAAKGKPFATAMGEAAVTSATSLIATAAMYGLYAVGRAIGRKFGWVQAEQPQHQPRQVSDNGSSGGGDGEVQTILKYAGYAREELGPDATANDIANMVLDKNPDEFDNEGKVKGVINAAIKKGELS